MFTINKDFSGGNIELVKIVDKNKVVLRQELRDSWDWWFYWAFRADNLPAESVKFFFGNGEVVGPFGPAVSTDGINWKWLGSDSLSGRKAFSYSNTEGHKQVYFAFCLGYQPKNLDLFIKKHQKNPLLRQSVLAASGSGAKIPLLEVGRADSKHHIIITARHHACEATGNYVMEGFLEYVLTSNGLLSQKCLIHAAPFIDYDGVVLGDQGKGRIPHDHNRDYIDEPLYASVRAVKALADKYEGSILAALDFHAPLQWQIDDPYADQDTAFAINSSNKYVPKEPDEGLEYWNIFKNHCKSGQEDIIVTDLISPDYMGANVKTKFAGYMRHINNVPITFSTETPYFGNPKTFTITPENMRKLGRNYAAALDDYLITKNI